MEVSKILGAILISLFMTSCSLFSAPEPKTEIEYITVKEPVVVVPAPPELPDITYELSTLTEEEMQNDGIYAKALVVTIMQLNDYSEVLELVIYKYKEMAEDSSIEMEERDIVEERRDGAEIKAGATPPSTVSSGTELERIRRTVRHEFDLELLQEKLYELKNKKYEIESPSSLREEL